MTDIIRVGIAGTGSFVPDRRLSNFDLEKMVDTSDAWIVERTGIRERRIVDDGVTCSDLALAASQRALESSGVAAKDLDLIIVATVTADSPLPSAASLLQHRLGAEKAAAFDLAAACAGFIYAASTGKQFIKSGRYKKVLVVGAEVLSSITDYEDRNSCILFGDGAGAAVLTADAPHGEILSSYLRCDGSGADLIHIPAGGSRLRVTHKTVDDHGHFMKLRGREVFKFAVSRMTELIESAIAKYAMTSDDLGIVIPHQVNLRVIDAALRRLEIPTEKVFTNIDRYGNTSAASIPIALDEARRANLLVDGKYVICVAFGAGLTWGSIVLRW